MRINMIIYELCNAIWFYKPFVDVLEANIRSYIIDIVIDGSECMIRYLSVCSSLFLVYSGAVLACVDSPGVIGTKFICDLDLPRKHQCAQPFYCWQDQLFFRTTYFEAFERVEEDTQKPANDSIKEAGIGRHIACICKQQRWWKSMQSLMHSKIM